MTNEEVSALLNLPMDEVEDLGEQLGVPVDQWTASDVFDADALLDESDEDEDEDPDSGDDECEGEEDQEDDDEDDDQDD